MTDTEKLKKKSGAPALDLDVTPAKITTRSNVLQLAESLIHTAPTEDEGTCEQMVTITVGRPKELEYFRIHPTLHGDVSLLKVNEGMRTEIYAVAPNMVPHVDGVKRYTVFFGVTLGGSSLLWPVSATSKDGYSRSARQIAIDAMTSWCRIVSDPGNGAYRKRAATKLKDEPTFPENTTLAELLVLGFGDGHIIDSEDHPIMKRMWL